MASEDRRRFPRSRFRRPCKIFHSRGEKFYLGWTRNVSAGGALIESARPLPLVPGDRVHFGVASHVGQAMLHTHEMVEAEVVRALRSADRHTTLAVRFAEPVDVPQTALRAAA